MSHKNPVHEAIYKSVVKPELEKRKLSVEGSIFHVDYYKQTAIVIWQDPHSGIEREATNVPIPVDGDGIYRRTLEVGDRVTLSFKNGNLLHPYISVVHQKRRGVNYESRNGAGIPKGMTFL